MSVKLQEYIEAPIESINITPSTSTQTIDVKYKATANVAAVPTTTVVEKEGSISGTTYTQGKVTVDTAGYIGTGDKVTGATFANVSTSGTTYKDISNTTAAPVLISDDYLYINKGYTDNVKISLAKLAPDEGSADLSSGDILSGKAAYNNDGKLIAGSIPSVSATTVTPKVTSQTAVASGNYLAGDITVGSIYTEVDTVSGMASTLTAENEGKMYKYTGTTGSGYVNGRIYIVEKEEASTSVPLCFTANTAGSTIELISPYDLGEDGETKSEWDMSGVPGESKTYYVQNQPV